MKSETGKRLGLRLSLRSLLVVTLLCSFGCGWVGQAAREYHREQTVLARLNKELPVKKPSVGPDTGG